MGILWKIISAPAYFVLYFTYIKSSFYSYVDVDYIESSNRSVLLLDDCVSNQSNVLDSKVYKDKIAEALRKKGFLVFYSSEESPLPIDLVAYFYTKCNMQEYTEYVDYFVENTLNYPGYMVTSSEIKNNISHSLDLVFYNPYNMQERVMSLHCDTQYATNHNYSDFFMYSFLIKESISKLDLHKSKGENFVSFFPLGIDQSKY